MTREEAIDVLENGKWWDFLSGISEEDELNALIELDKAMDMAIAALREQEERRWIAVTERLPDKNVKVLGYAKYLCTETYRILPVRWNIYVWCDTTGIRMQVTHWMPLPEPPKEDVP